MKFARDYFNDMSVPDYVLTKANKERIGIIRCSSKTLDIKFKDCNEISFRTYLYIDNEKNPYYEAVDNMKYVLLPDIGFFSILECSPHSEGTEFEYKEVTAKSYECLMAQKYLELFVINMGTVESIDSVTFYNLADKSHSLLHLILEKCPEWEIGHIDSELITMQRSFQVDRQDIYSFLMNDVSTAFECVFLFDTLTCTINIYKEENVGEDTDIHVSYNNLLKNTDISCSTEDIKTCLTITGADDLTVREINMGSEQIYNLNYYNSTDYMSEGLHNAFNNWVKIRNDNLPAYTALLSQYQDYYKEIHYLTSEKMPDDLENTDWTLYGLNPLIEKLAAYEQMQAVSMKAGHGDPSSEYYQSEYLPIYNSIVSINAQIEIVKKQIKDLEDSQTAVGEKMADISNAVSLENNFSEEHQKELSSFIREDELSSDNFVVTDTMTDDERFDMLNQMLDYAEKELYKAAVPQLSFSVNMLNIFSLADFDKLSEKFDAGNYIWVTLRDDYHVKAKLLSMHINFYDETDFSVTFGNVSRKAKNRYSDISEILKDTASAATSVSFNQSYWNQASKDTENINQMLADGLLSAGVVLTDGTKSEMIIDDRGIFVNTSDESANPYDSIFIGAGRILFTDDDWKSVSMAVGRANVKGESRFGVFADFCIAGYIAGSTIEGGTITGTVFNNGNGTFLVDEDGKLTASSATVKGTIQAVDGWFGGENGFRIASGKAYTNNKNAWNSSVSGVYLGTDGISLGAGSPFSVDQYGNLTAKSGTIGSIKIANDRIYSENNNFSIDSNGHLITKYITITGVQHGSSFGDINYGTDGTFGNFTNGFYADTSFGLTGGAKAQFDSLVVGNITAENIRATNVLADYATFNWVNANFFTADEIRSSYATIDTLNGVNADLSGQITAANAKFNNLNASNITAGTLSFDRLQSYNGASAQWVHYTVVYDVDFSAQEVKRITLHYLGTI